MSDRDRERADGVTRASIEVHTSRVSVELSEFSAGALCRETIHSEPTVVAGAMREWFGPDNPITFAAISWLREIADALEEAER